MADLAIADAILEVRRRINDTTTNVVTDAQITEWLHRGARNVSVITLCKPVVNNVVLLENQMRYTLGSDFVKVNVVLRTNRDGTSEEEGLQRIHPRHVGSTYLGTPGVPKYWFDWRQSGNENYIYVFPTPSATAALGTSEVHVHGYMIVDDYGAGDELPDQANNLSILYAVACGFIREGKHAKAALEMQRYLNAVSNMRQVEYEHHQMPDTIDMGKIPDTKVYPERQ